jgi:hypothetical protein
MSPNNHNMRCCRTCRPDAIDRSVGVDNQPERMTVNEQETPRCRNCGVPMHLVRTLSSSDRNAEMRVFECGICLISQALTGKPSDAQGEGEK